MASNLHLSKYLSVVGLSLLLACLVCGLFGWIRYEQVTNELEREKQARYKLKIEYLSKVVKDGQTINIAIDRLVGSLKNEKDRQLLAGALKELEAECRSSIRGLEGKVNPVTSYDKDLRLVPGVSKSRHEEYRSLMEELLETVIRLKTESDLPPALRARYIDELSALAKKIDKVIEQ